MPDARQMSRSQKPEEPHPHRAALSPTDMRGQPALRASNPDMDHARGYWTGSAATPHMLKQPPSCGAIAAAARPSDGKK
eukprot:scaffold5263_cov146-Isochrysis_galbana.AAC.3